ncbi:unnamed protein product [Amoebophrya sp. A120]|nr:unnamed protein product [Amoebophrya sp. A120]|eukprot:GSA120T00022771001.1
MNDHPASVWSVLALRNGGPARARERRAAVATRRFLNHRRRTGAMRGLKDALERFEGHDELQVLEQASSSSSPRSSDQEDADHDFSRYEEEDGQHQQQNLNRSSSRPARHPDARTNAADAAPGDEETRRKQQRWVRRPCSALAQYDYGAISAQPRSLYTHLIKKGRGRDIDRPNLHGNRRRLYTTAPLPGMSHSSWNRQDPIFLAKGKAQCSSLMPVAARSQLLLQNPSTWAEYRNCAGVALEELQTDDHRIPWTRTQELRRRRTAECLDCLAVDETLESRRQWAGQQWGNSKALRYYTQIPNGAAPVRSFRDQVEVVALSQMAQDLHYSSPDDDCVRKKLYYRVDEAEAATTSSGGACSSSSTSGGGAGGAPAPTTWSSSYDSALVDVVFPSDSFEREENNNYPGSTIVGMSSSYNKGNIKQATSTDYKNYLPLPTALKRPWHDADTAAGVLLNEVEDGSTSQGKQAPSSSLSSSVVPAKTQKHRTKDDIVVEYRDEGSIVCEPYRSLLTRLLYMTRLRKISVLRLCKAFTREENAAHGFLPAESFHRALEKLEVVSNEPRGGFSTSCSATVRNKKMNSSTTTAGTTSLSFTSSHASNRSGAMPVAAWSFRQTMEFCWWLRKFQFRVDGGEYDEGLIDLHLVDHLVTQVEREQERDERMCRRALAKLTPPDRFGKTLRFAEELLAREREKRREATKSSRATRKSAAVTAAEHRKTTSAAMIGQTLLELS